MRLRFEWRDQSPRWLAACRWGLRRAVAVAVGAGALLAFAATAPDATVTRAHTASALAARPANLLEVDYQKLVSSADIILDHPVSRREAGMPIGAGRMGSLVWTTPSAMKFQLDHTDVYANDGSSKSFFYRESDYGFGLGFVDIDFVDFGPEMFTQENTRQHLSVYEGLLQIDVRGVQTRVKRPCDEQMELVAYFYWLRYDHSMDEDWLRDRAYPVLKRTAELFRNFPILTKEVDGKYHLNNYEPVRGCQDPMESITAMKGILTLALRASEILDVDGELRPQWRELLDNLTSLPTNDDPGSLTPRQPGQPRFWTAGRKPFQGGRTDWRRLIPVVYYGLCILENPDRRLHETADASFDHAYPNVNRTTRVHVLSRSAMAAALLGRAAAVKSMIPNQIRQSEAQIKRFIDYRRTRAGILDNRMTMREGAEAIGIQRLGRAAAATQYALLQRAPPAPGKDPAIRVFPAWSDEWDADFTLAARGDFLVSASQRNRKVLFVELHSRAAHPCRLRNPWPGTTVTLYRHGSKAGDLTGALLQFDTARGDTFILLPRGQSPSFLKRSLPEIPASKN